MLTKEGLRNATQHIEQIDLPNANGYFLQPPVEVVSIKTNRNFYVDKVDATWGRPVKIHLQELNEWWPIELFKLKGM